MIDRLFDVIFKGKENACYDTILALNGVMKVKAVSRIGWPLKQIMSLAMQVATMQGILLALAKKLSNSI